MNYLSEKYGLVTDNDPVSENGQLFLVEYIFLLENSNVEELKNLMDSQLEISKISEGLYNRNPDLVTRTMSHDNLSAIFAYSKQFNTVHRFKIFSYLITHLGTYDNTKGKSPDFSKFLPFNPANFFIWGLSAEFIFCYLFFPFYLINLIITCSKSKQDTSGKLLTWVELYPFRNHWLCKHLFEYFSNKMQAMYGTQFLKELMRIYHGNNSKEFPINKFLGIGV